jgi:phosphohistidine phosphatase
VKWLGLLRHAKSDWDDLARRDFDRGLNARGRRGATLMGRHIRDHGEVWDMILASPAERVKRTLEASAVAIPVHWEPDAYLADAETLIGLIRQLEPDLTSVLIAGHNPGLHDLLGKLVAREARDELVKKAVVKFPTAAFAVLELDIEHWADCAVGCARLTHFARPRDLDPELGPED